MSDPIETEEIEVTKIIERLENVEKENSTQKEISDRHEKTIASVIASIDRLADLLRKRG